MSLPGPTGATSSPVSYARSLPPIVTFALLLAAGSASADGRAAVKQAEGLLAEQEKDIPQALGLLREAAKLDPSDIDVAFDRARIALEHADLAQPADYDDYLKLEPVTADQRLLRAYILAARGRTDEARVEAQGAAAADPTNTEALGLVQALAPSSDPTPADDAIAGRVRVFGRYDTNVSVLPDRTAAGSSADPNAVADATDRRRAAGALGVEGDVRWTPVRGVTEFSLLGGLSFLAHVNGRNDETDAAGNILKQGAKTYDYGTVDLQARLAFPRDRWNSAIELYGSSVFIETFQKRYLTEGTLLGAANYAIDEGKSFRVGAYGLGGLRSFGAGFGDRDGQRVEGGLTADYGKRRVGLGVRGGYQMELANDSLTERGPQAMAYVRGSIDRLDGIASFVFQKRDYYKIDRNDSRFGPTVQLAYAMNDTIAVVGIYQYLRNVSTVADGAAIDYDYSRHLATLGLEARL